MIARLADVLMASLCEVLIQHTCDAFKSLGRSLLPRVQQMWTTVRDMIPDLRSRLRGPATTSPDIEPGTVASSVQEQESDNASSLNDASSSNDATYTVAS